MSKAGAEVILKSLLGMEIDIDALPEGEEERVPAGVETIVLASEVMGRDGRRIVAKERERGKAIVKLEEDDGLAEGFVVIKDEPEA